MVGSISLAASLLLQLFPLQLSQSHHTSSQYKLFSIHVVINRLGVCKGWKRCPPWNTYNKLVFSIQIRRLGNNLCIIIPLEKWVYLNRQVLDEIIPVWKKGILNTVGRTNTCPLKGSPGQYTVLAHPATKAWLKSALQPTTTHYHLSLSFFTIPTGLPGWKPVCPTFSPTLKWRTAIGPDFS